MAEATLVVDMGSSSTKLGLSSEDYPVSVFPTAVGTWAKGTESIEHFGTDVADSAMSLGVHHPIQRGAVKNWDQVEKVWESVMEELNLSVSDNMSTLLVESNKPGPDDNEKWARVLSIYL